MHNAWEPRACLLQKCWRRLIHGVTIGISASGDAAVDSACLRSKFAPSRNSDDDVNDGTLKSGCNNFWRLQQSKEFLTSAKPSLALTQAMSNHVCWTS